jgi:allantoinase
VTELTLRSRRVITPDGERPAAVCVRDGRIDTVERYEFGGDDLGDLVLMPGLVDTHVHINEPGRTSWEGFATASRAAAAGGVTTLIDMPLNSIPPTVSVAALDQKRAAASGQCMVDVGFWGGAVPGNAAELPALHRAGVFGFKCFLVDSGVPEFPPLDAAGLDAALRAVDALFVVHAEDPLAVTPSAPSHRYADFVSSRPHEAECLAVAQVIDTAARLGARAHILHLSSAQALPLLAAAQRDGVQVSAETCPHYLVLTAEDVPDGATEYKCCPPVRDAANREALWQGLAAGTVHCVVSDHSPCPAELKRGDFAAAWGGIASVQLGLSVMWTEARRRGHPLATVVRWMAYRPAELVGLRHKGRIAAGADADLVAFDPDATFLVDPHLLHHRHPVTPYAGQRLTGVVRDVWLRGVRIDGVPRGRLLTRETNDGI